MEILLVCPAGGSSCLSFVYRQPPYCLLRCVEQGIVTIERDKVCRYGGCPDLLKGMPAVGASKDAVDITIVRMILYLDGIDRKAFVYVFCKKRDFFPWTDVFLDLLSHRRSNSPYTKT